MSFILFEVKGNIGYITLNRPDKLNSFNREMALQLQQVLDECSVNAAIRCVYLTGAGKAFCAGQDLAEVTQPNAPGFDKILSEHYNPIISRIRNINKPVVAAVNGVAAGAGANIALACDIVVAAENASFLQAFSKIGLIPDSGGTFFLPRLIGFQKAAALMMLGDKVPASEALQMGMLYKVFPAEAFAEESIKIAETLSQMPTMAMGYIKQALNSSMANSLEQQLVAEDQLQQRSAATKDYAEGVNAFLEKRQAQFTGQ